MKNKNKLTIRDIQGILFLMLIMIGSSFTTSLKASNPAIPGITIAPTALPATDITVNSFKANWSADQNAEYYILYVYSFEGYHPFGNMPIWLVLPNYNGGRYQNNNASIQGLSLNKRYKYLVRAIDSQDNWSAESNEMEVLTLGAAPVAKAATSITTVSFTANWNASPGAVSYMLTVNDVTGGSTKLSNRIVSGLSYSVTGLNPNNAYSYDVKANFDVVVSVPSNLITVNTLPTPPVATAATTINTTSFNANWNAVAGATGYKLWVYSNESTGYNPAGYFPKTIGNFTSYTINGLTSGHSYSYFVQVITSLGTSAVSNLIEVTTKPIAPAATPATDITAVSFTANWNAVEGATGYLLEVIDVTCNATRITASIHSRLSYSLTGLSPNNEYSYTVKAKLGDVVSAESNAIKVNTNPIAPVAIAPANITSSSFEAKWNAVAGATGYKLWIWSNVSTGYNPAGYFPKTIGNFTNHTISGLTSGHSYSYFVQAITSLGTSAASNGIDVTTKPIAPAAMNASDITFNSFVANWQTVVGATGYKLSVWRKSDFQWVPDYNGKIVTGTSELISGLDPSTEYQYGLKALVGETESDNSNYINVTTGVSNPPRATAATDITAVSFTANWNTVEGATSYLLTVRNVTDGVNKFKDKVITVLSSSVTGLFIGKEYSYTVKARFGDATSAESNAITVITQLTMPVASAATIITSVSFTANWQTVVGATSYKLWVWKKVGDQYVTGYEAKPVSTNSAIVTGLSPETEYIYAIKALAGAVESDLSNHIEVATAQSTVQQYTLSLSASPAGAGTVSGGGTFSSGTSHTAIATPATGYNFVNWTEGGAIVSSAASYTFSITANRVLIANFTQQVTNYTLSLSANPTVGGTVSGGGTFSSGTSHTAIATPATGYNFVNWTEGDAVVSTAASYTFNITANRILVANFSTQSSNYTLSLSANPTLGGTVSGGGTFSSGSSATAKATVATGYDFVNWTDESGAVVSTAASYTFNITANRTLVANFVQQVTSVTLSLSANPSVGGIVNGGGTFNSGSSVTAEADAATGYKFVNWTENGTEVSTSLSYKFTLTANRILVANFEKKQAAVFTVTLNVVGDGGTINFETKIVEQGAEVTIIATPTTGYKFVNWTVSSIEISMNAEYTFVVTENITLTAHFEKKTALAEKALENLKVYPNPVSDFLNISGVPLKSVITLVTLSGSKVKQIAVQNAIETFDTQDIPKGVYFLIVETPQNCTTRKVILQ